jgi:septin family protein
LYFTSLNRLKIILVKNILEILYQTKTNLYYTTYRFRLFSGLERITARRSPALLLQSRSERYAHCSVGFGAYRPSETRSAPTGNEGAHHVLVDRSARGHSYRSRCCHYRPRNLPSILMTPQDLASEVKQRKTMDDAHRRANERAQNLPTGLRSTAQGLRDRARNMTNLGDRAAMLRLASGYDQRASDLDERPKARTTR